MGDVKPGLGVGLEAGEVGYNRQRREVERMARTTKRYGHVPSIREAGAAKAGIAAAPGVASVHLGGPA